jgi:hypothetical protein
LVASILLLMIVVIVISVILKAAAITPAVMAASLAPVVASVVSESIIFERFSISERICVTSSDFCDLKINFM